jgi:arsenite methyltransferase
MGLANVELQESLIESLPLADASVDVVISDGAIDLVVDKDAVFSEIDRVLRPGGRLQVADVVIHTEVSEDARKRIDLWTGCIAGALPEGEHARILVGMGYIDIKQGDLVDTYARSTFEDTRRKAEKFGATGSVIRANKRKLTPLRA